MSMALRLFAWTALAGGLGVAVTFITDVLIGPTHNVAAVLIDLVTGAVAALLTLTIGGYLMFRK